MRRSILACLIVLLVSVSVSAQDNTIAHLGLGYQYVFNATADNVAQKNSAVLIHALAVNLFAIKTSDSGFYLSASLLVPLSSTLCVNSVYTDSAVQSRGALGLNAQFGYMFKIINTKELSLNVGAGIDYLGFLYRQLFVSLSFSQMGFSGLANLEIDLGSGFYFDANVDGSIYLLPIAGGVFYKNQFVYSWGIKSVIGIGYRF